MICLVCGEMAKTLYAPWRVIRHRVGRRGAFLGFLALLDYGYASSLWPLQVPRHYTLIVAPHVWAIAWLVAAVACTVGMFMRRDRVPYTVAATIKTLWAALYCDLAFVQHYPKAWVSAAVWLTFALLVMMVSSWPDPVFTELARRDGEGL